MANVSIQGRAIGSHWDYYVFEYSPTAGWSARSVSGQDTNGGAAVISIDGCDNRRYITVGIEIEAGGSVSTDGAYYDFFGKGAEIANFAGFESMTFSTAYAVQRLGKPSIGPSGIEGSLGSPDYCCREPANLPWVVEPGETSVTIHVHDLALKPVGLRVHDPNAPAIFGYMARVTVSLCDAATVNNTAKISVEGIVVGRHRDFFLFQYSPTAGWSWKRSSLGEDANQGEAVVSIEGSDSNQYIEVGADIEASGSITNDGTYYDCIGREAEIANVEGVDRMDFSTAYVVHPLGLESIGPIETQGTVGQRNRGCVSLRWEVKPSQTRVADVHINHIDLAPVGLCVRDPGAPAVFGYLVTIAVSLFAPRNVPAVAADAGPQPTVRLRLCP